MPRGRVQCECLVGAGEVERGGACSVGDLGLGVAGTVLNLGLKRKSGRVAGGF